MEKKTCFFFILTALLQMHVCGYTVMHAGVSVNILDDLKEEMTNLLSS